MGRACSSGASFPGRIRRCALAIGEELRRARESQGQTLVDVAKATGNTPVDRLQAVEEGRFPPIEREYTNTVMAYARHVGLELAQFEVDQPRTGRIAIAVVALVLLAAAAVAGVTAFTGGTLSIGSAQTVSAAEVASAASASTEASAETGQPANTLGGAAGPDTGTSTAEPAPTELPTQLPTEPPKEPPIAQPTDVVPTATLAATSTSLPPSPTALPRGSVAPTGTVPIAVNTFDQAEYVYVAAGPATIGLPPALTDQPANESPPSEVTLDGYWLKRTEVTNSEYARCVQAGACTAPANHVWEDDKYHNYPVANVTWAQANDYARWIGGRLPTEAEWEKGCRGPRGFVFPWGNAVPRPEYANYDNLKKMLIPVEFYSPKYASPYGLVDMAGNAAEWTANLEMPYPYRADDGREDTQAAGPRVFRGGSFMSDYRNVRCTARYSVDPNRQQNNMGFRVVWSNSEPNPRTEP